MDKPQIEIQFLTRAQQQRRDDWAIARATIHSPLGTYGGHTIHDYAERGRLSVGAAPGSILNPDSKTWILQAYHSVLVRDRYWAEREAYGIWHVASCSDGKGANGPKHYMIHRVFGTEQPESTYQRYQATSISEALTMAERSDTPGAYTYGIMSADYAEARAEGIAFFEGDGLLV